jgi:type VI secretion system protein ImpA
MPGSSLDPTAVMTNSLLCEPVSVDTPCGIDLEDTQLLASFDAFRIFGSDTPLRTDIDWPGIREQALAALGQSRDFRLLAHFAAATLRIEGIRAFCEVLTVADRWLAERWEQVFPRVEDDALLRKNALNCFADRMAIVAPLRRSPIVSHRQFGAVTLRDVELATGQLDATETDRNAPAPAQIEAALTDSSAEELATLLGNVTGAADSLERIVARMQQHAGPQAAPDFDPLRKSLERIRKIVSQNLAARAAENSGARVSGTSGEAAGRPDGVDVNTVSVQRDGRDIINSRQDAIRAIDAAVLFFRRHEPSSPVPLLLERAKRLVSKSFMEVLEDVAPEGLPQARLIVGNRADAE